MDSVNNGMERVGLFKGRGDLTCILNECWVQLKVGLNNIEILGFGNCFVGSYVLSYKYIIFDAFFFLFSTMVFDDCF